MRWEKGVTYVLIVVGEYRAQQQLTNLHEVREARDELITRGVLAGGEHGQLARELCKRADEPMSGTQRPFVGCIWTTQRRYVWQHKRRGGRHAAR